jgi:murein DD-endopeptidase MepM/ murein hydrolase activator NlpD
MKYIKIIVLFAGINIFSGCDKYLDIIPDEITTMDHVFVNRTAAERYLFTCYSYIPKLANPWNSPTILGEDEYWWDIDVASFTGRPTIRIALGYQNVDNPILDYWNGEGFRGADDQRSLFVALRDCNIFLENIHVPPDLSNEERTRWIAEVKFLKAYYHFFLMQLYGPIPIIKENLPVSATPEEVRVRREPVDDVVEYIVQLLDEAAPGLPLSNALSPIDAGRITKPAALAVKAQALVWAASPLFNGNPDYVNFRDNDGRLLFDPEKKVSKWERAAEAIKNAIDTSLYAGHNLYHEYRASLMTLSPTTRLKCIIRGAVTERFNEEQIWPGTFDEGELQGYVAPNLEPGSRLTAFSTNEIHATLKMAEQYYTRNGIPVDEDPEWITWLGGNFANRYDIQTVTSEPGIDENSTLQEDHQYYIGSGEVTAKLNFYREPRFYASLGFDRGVWELNGNGENNFFMKARDNEDQGRLGTDRHSCTGYFVKKMINMNSSRRGDQWYPTRYSYPIIRLADLYLLYAEALNEINGPAPEAYLWIDRVRERAGLKGVQESWLKSSVPAKPNSQDGLREIIKRERLIELSFEGGRFWDLRRWKDAMKHMNQAVQGWDYKKSGSNEYYQVVTIQQANKRAFSSRDYLWPIKVKDLQTNSNLVQNPGWSTGLRHDEKWE